MKPERPLLRHLAEAGRTGYRSGRQNLPAMLALQGVMVGIVGLYYLCPAARPLFTRIAEWQREGGPVAAAILYAFAGGVLSEASAVYFQNGGRWTRAHVGDMAFRMALFGASGAIVFEFYRLQAYLFGDGPGFFIVLPKLLVDQFGYSVFWSAPSQTILTRWHALHYSTREVWRELRTDMIFRRMLPVLVTNWMFWIPIIILVYLMPLNLQVPLAVVATAIWGLLLNAAARQPRTRAVETASDLALDTSL